MKEFIEKLISRLEKCIFSKSEILEYNTENQKHLISRNKGIKCAIKIVNELAEEYINTSTDISTDTSTDTSTTNADRIRSMTDEELAEFFEKLEVVCDMCAFKVGCCNIVSGNCKSGLLKWLQSEVEGVTENE